MAFNLADMVNNRKPVETENISDTVYRDVFGTRNHPRRISILQIQSDYRD